MRERVNRGEVVLEGGFVFVGARAAPRAEQQDITRRLTVLATERAARNLCGVAPEALGRLQAQLQGVTMVDRLDDAWGVQVIVRVPVQTPSCRLLPATSAAAAAPPAAGGAWIQGPGRPGDVLQRTEKVDY